MNKHTQMNTWHKAVHKSLAYSTAMMCLAATISGCTDARSRFAMLSNSSVKVESTAKINFELYPVYADPLPTPHNGGKPLSTQQLADLDVKQFHYELDLASRLHPKLPQEMSILVSRNGIAKYSVTRFNNGKHLTFSGVSKVSANLVATLFSNLDRFAAEKIQVSKMMSFNEHGGSYSVEYAGKTGVENGGESRNVDAAIEDAYRIAHSLRLT